MTNEKREALTRIFYHIGRDEAGQLFSEKHRTLDEFRPVMDVILARGEKKEAQHE